MALRRKKMSVTTKRSTSLILTGAIVLLIVLAPCWLLAAGTCGVSSCSGTTPWTAASPSYGDVNYCVNTCAKGGDTVVVPAGSGSTVWDNTLVITKGVKLIGPGKNNLKVVSNHDATAPTTAWTSGNFLIVYKPDATLNEPFRLSGFTFDMNNKCGGLFLYNPDATPINNIRVDNNSFLNAKTSVGTMRAIIVYGTVYGVIDNNVFSGNAKCIDSYGANTTSWNNLTFSFGSADNLYYEDNTFYLTTTPHSGGAGGRYAARYNTYYYDAGGLYPWFDAHGNQIGANLSAMGTEIYGNKLYHGYPTSGVSLFAQRGGKAVVFNNDISSSGSIIGQTWEEYWDGYNLPATGPSGQPQHVSDSYYWGNKKNSATPVKFLISMDYYNRSQDIVNAPAVLVENLTHWQQAESFDGTSGIGCGTSSARPIKCTAGVAYWETNQSCTNLAGMTGANPTSPISGTLYKCTTTNTWTQAYIPYKYPHPLRVENSVSVPVNLRIAQNQ